MRVRDQGWRGCRWRCGAGQALKRDHGHLAARLIGATAAARDSIGLTPWPTVIEAERRTIEQTEALPPSGEFARQTASGRSQTIADALTQAPLPPGGGRRAAQPLPAAHICGIPVQRRAGVPEGEMK